MSVSSPGAESPDVDCENHQLGLPSSTTLSIDERLEIFLEANLVASLIDVNELGNCGSTNNNSAPDNLLLDSLSTSTDCVVSGGGGGVSRAIGKQRRRGTYDLTCTDGTETSPLPQPPNSWLLDEPAQDLNRTFCLVPSAGDGASATPSSANVSPLILGDEFQHSTRQSASSRSSYATAKSSLSPLQRLVEVGDNDDDEASSDAATVSYSPPLPPPPPQCLADESDSLMAEVDEADCTLVPQSLTKIPPSPLTLPPRIDQSKLARPSEYRGIPEQAAPDSEPACQPTDHEYLHLSSENAVFELATRLHKPDAKQCSKTSPNIEYQLLNLGTKSRHSESQHLKSDIQSQYSESHNFKPEIQSHDSESHNLKPEIQSHDSESHNLKPEIQSHDSESHNFKPEIQSHDSESHNFKPEIHSHDSESHNFKPEIQSHDSESHNLKPEIQSHDSESHNLKPEIQSHDSESHNFKPEIQSHDSESHNFKPEIQSPDSESHNFKPEIQSPDSESHNFKPEIQSPDSESHNFKPEIQSPDSESQPLKSESKAHNLQAPLNDSETQPENYFPLHPAATLPRRVGSLCPPKSASSLPLQTVSQPQRLAVGSTGLPKSRLSCLQTPQQFSASLPAPQNSRLRAPLAVPSQTSGLRAPASLPLQPIRTVGSRLPGPANSASASAGTFGAARASGLRRPAAMPPPR